MEFAFLAHTSVCAFLCFGGNVMYNEQRFICDVDEENIAVIIEDADFKPVCMVMEKTNIIETPVEYIHIPTESACVYGDYKCVYFSGNLFIINKNSHKVELVPDIEKVFYLDTSIFAITKKQNRYDGFVKIDTKDFSFEHIGRFKYRNLLR